MTTIELTAKESIFVTCYLATVDFTETGDTDQPESGADLDDDFIRESTIDCLSFYSRICCYLSDDEVERAAHDFWLTRNGHGAGFWDGDWPLYGDIFTRIAQGYGEAYAIFDELHSNTDEG